MPALLMLLTLDQHTRGMDHQDHVYGPSGDKIASYNIFLCTVVDSGVL